MGAHRRRRRELRRRHALLVQVAESDGADPTRALPRAPESVVTLKAEWSWNEIGEREFTRLLRNFGEWCERNSDAGSPYATMFAVMTAASRQPQGKIELRAMSIEGAGAERQLKDHLASVADGVAVPHSRTVATCSWLSFALNPFPDLFFIGPGGTSASAAKLKLKDALLRRCHTERQLRAMYEQLTRPDAIGGGGIGLATYGGQINTVAPDATAAAQRSSVIDSAYSAGWQNPAEEARSLEWVRRLYRNVFADTGGVPAPSDATEGALITHPDADLADPAWNTSGVPWHAMYYNGNYARLQRVKARWDPRNVFRHALSIRLPD